MMNHRIVLAALPLLAGLAHGQAWELPEEVPTAPIFNDQTIVLVSSFPIAELTDLDLDGFVTDRDFRLYIASKLADTLTIKDIDGDGVITATDEVGSLAILLDKLSGDTNGDGVKDAADTADFLDLYTNPVGAELAFINKKTADLNLDGQVTGDDFALYLNAFAIAVLPDRITVAVDLLANIEGTLTEEEYTEGHIRIFSRQWPGHHKDSSRAPYGVPPNHVLSLSEDWQGWHDDDHSILWPPRHHWARSAAWDPTVHNRENSQWWPADHSLEISVGWENPGGISPHDTVASQYWTPDHRLNVSRSWIPRPHSAFLSQLNENPDFPPEGGDWPEWPDWIPARTEHMTYWSSSWNDPEGNPVHLSEISLIIWPPNHFIDSSGTWAQHDLNVSVRWPSNHHMTISEGWPLRDGNPPQWPANHGVDRSKQDQQPATPEEPFNLPIFPGGHNMQMTFMDWAPFFPLLLP